MGTITLKHESMSIDHRNKGDKTTYSLHLIRYYLRARLLYPKNGKSCKQLAILAVLTVRDDRHFPLIALLFFDSSASTVGCNLLLCSSIGYDEFERQRQTKSDCLIRGSASTRTFDQRSSIFHDNRCCCSSWKPSRKKSRIVIRKMKEKSAQVSRCLFAKHYARDLLDGI